ncbi:hypothetical protein NVP1152O_093 [Vibrio phage 1.152.O._10N.222.46.E1]|uniref:Uncharacterized protein n=5 Tax=Nahantvirus 49C7 TaxID=2846601 RepID=A0A2I7RBJ0_9CAUD|nr:hypothetical protein HYP57_gp093 [Vibrio phage 1.026.O._10N.222.49.C7]AUR82575.1 hypothetical protein NVP1025O_092 [Vibrio phage 1.025.O._10N.222.46.B6]AUR90825.1 hypothetical protein NVP1150O_092 [Vibrio phage 1.150.O._10N.222.46.A6]AUR90998.1 hypothetical protein NVP1152O_093 [Vibrio phage 1.152.O._10N.222.46.E1]AUS02466.1 hypothetical protein NVP2130O_092 [Vibrio phage 2.130.O._10N.222.46.C2]AUR82683.1 hypothetical protein NVP1026O_092 [Vibrio phage 1.026.O._10N.222.49.C7]
MLKLYRDLNDHQLPWIVVSDTQWGNWKGTIEAAVDSYETNLAAEGVRGEDPYVQNNIRVEAEGLNTEELKLMMVLNG